MRTSYSLAEWQAVKLTFFAPWEVMIFCCSFLLYLIFTSRGFAHSSVDALRPLPERPEESLPLSYIETVQSAISNFTPDTSGQSSPTTDNTPSIVNGLSESNTWSTHTGILTGRSTCSVNSWGNEDVSEGLSLVLGSLLGFIINIIIYYIDTSVLLENIPLVKFIKTTSGTRVVYFP